MITIQQYNSMVSQMKAMQEYISMLKSGSNSKSSLGTPGQSLHLCKILLANGDDPQTYKVRVLVGSNHTETAWTIDRALSSDPSVTFAADDYAVLLLNDMGGNYLLSSGGGGGSSMLTRHSHSGYYDGGYAGFYSGDI